MPFKVTNTIKTHPIVSEPRNIIKMDESFSSRLVNFTESVNINGIKYTKFYTELDTNLKVGDKVYIINGIYDTHNLIKKNHYIKGSDGYKILQIDRTGIVLDIEYIGLSVWESDVFDNYIKLYRAGKDDFGNYPSPAFDGQMNIKYEEFQTAYKPFKYTYGYNGNNNIMHATLGISQTDTFRVYDAITGSWVDITSGFESNNLPTLSGTNFTNNNGKVLVVGETFTHNGDKFIKDQIYKFSNGKWIKDISSTPSFLTKASFRKGTFKKGTFNDGVFGNIESVEKWIGSSWRNGIFYNSNWIEGTIESKSDKLPRQNYYSHIENGNLKETTDFGNNFGFGYNLIVDSTIETATIINSNIENSKLGLTSVGTQSAILSYHDGNVNNFNNALNIEKSRIDSTDVENVILQSGTYKYSNIKNSIVKDGKSLDCNIIDTVFLGGEIDGNSIEILDYDRIILSDDYKYENPYAYTASIGTSSGSLIVSHKFYISEKDFKKIRRGDHIYFNNLKTSNPIISGIFDSEFYVGGNDMVYWLPTGPGEFYNGEIDERAGFGRSNRNKFKFTIFLKNAEQNSSIKTVDLDTGFPNLKTVTHKQLPSIDLVIKCDSNIYDSNATLQSYLDSKYGVKISNIKDATIQRSKFKNSVFDNVKWKSSKFNDLDLVIKRTTTNINQLDISIGGTFSNYYMDVKLGRDLTSISRLRSDTDIWYTDKLKVGDVMYMDKIKYLEGTYSSDLSGKYIVSTFSNSTRIMRLEDYPNDNTLNNGFTYTSGYFQETIGEPTFTSLHTNLIINSEIESGVFKRVLIENSNLSNIDDNNLIDSENFINNDLDIKSLNKLKFMNMLICSKSNLNIKYGIFYQSFINNSTFENGIIFKSSIDNINFNSGVIKESYSLNCNFNNGVFVDSNGSYISDVSIPGEDWSYTSIVSRWGSGTFSDGIMYNSNFRGGNFNGGKFYKGVFIGGNFNNGTFGDIRYNDSDTIFGQSGLGPSWNNGIFSNGQFGPESSTVLIWKNGIFNGGIMDGSSVFPNIPGITWMDGTFNNGEIINNVRWDSGIFNNGKFNSSWGTGYGTESNNYSWVDGTFNNGEFGVGTASVTGPKWKYGVFNGGIFKGHIWNDGIFTGGKFIGGTDKYATVTPDLFSLDFNNLVGGFWRNGIVKDNLQEIKKLSIFESVTDNIKKFKGEVSQDILFENMIWANGTFSNGTMKNSMWWSGKFKGGNFIESNFNPYVSRWNSKEIELYKPDYIGNPGTAVSHYDLGSQSCIWYNGNFKNSKFQISQWENGSVNIGTFSSIDWKNGVVLYADMDNSIWNDGLWRNGNWQGSPFKLTDVTDNSGYGTFSSHKYKDEILHQMLRLNTKKVHGWSIVNRKDCTLTVNRTGTWTVGRSSNGVSISAGIDSSNLTIFSTFTGNGSGTMSIPYGYYVKSNIVYSGLAGSGTPDDFCTFTTDSGEIGKGNFDKDGSNFLPFDSNIFLSELGGITDGHFECIPEYSTINNTEISLTSSLVDTLTYSSISNSIGYEQELVFPGFESIIPNFEIKKTIFTDDFSSDNGWAFNENVIGGSTMSRTFSISSGVMSLTYSSIPMSGFTWEDEAVLSNILEIGKEYEISLTISNRFGTDSTGNGPNISLFPSTKLVAGNNVSFTYMNKITRIYERLVCTSTRDLKIRFKHSPSSTYNSITQPSFIILDNLVVKEILPTKNNSKIGTGKFIKGIWENGVWNSGLRKDVNYEIFNDVDIFYKLDRNSWRVTVKGSTASNVTDTFNIGDNISVGNIIALDINGNRKLLKDTYKVVDINGVDETISFDIDMNFPIRKISKDSDKHIIQITRNNWKSGLFLNGVFEGVWNNGYIKGYPSITQMTHSQWIDGTIDGLDFNSKQNSYISGPNTATSSYNTGVIQNMRFIEGDDGSRYVNSILDVNWENVSEKTSINIQDTFFYVGNPLTHDVLSSISTFLYGSNTISLELGSKFKEFENLITDDLLDVIPPERLEDRGWTFSFKGSASMGPTQSIFTGNNGSNDIYNNIDIYHPGGSTPSAILGFENVTGPNSQIIKNRYYKQTFNIPTWTTPIKTPPNGYIDFHTSLANYGDNFINYDKWNSGITKYTKYTWNWQGTTDGKFWLETFNWEGNIDNIEFTELNMIPMHQYWIKNNDMLSTPNIKDRNLSIQNPYFATAPFIDYNNSNFSFIDNVTFDFNEGNVGSGSSGGGDNSSKITL